jgi:hypothetical protein
MKIRGIDLIIGCRKTVKKRDRTVFSNRLEGDFFKNLNGREKKLDLDRGKNARPFPCDENRWDRLWMQND